MINDEEYLALVKKYHCDRIEDADLRRRTMTNAMRIEINSFIQGGKMLSGNLSFEGEHVKVQSYATRLQELVKQLQVMESEGRLDSLLREVVDVYGTLRISMQYKDTANGMLADFADYVSYELEHLEPEVVEVEKPVEIIKEKIVEVTRDVIPEGYQLVPSGFVVVSDRELALLRKATRSPVITAEAKKVVAKAEPVEVLEDEEKDGTASGETDWEEPVVETATPVVDADLDGLKVFKPRKTDAEKKVEKAKSFLTEKKELVVAKPIAVVEAPVDARLEVVARAGGKMAAAKPAEIKKVGKFWGGSNDAL